VAIVGDCIMSACSPGEHERRILAGAAPIPASSGKTVRHRLNRSGNRQLNRALHTIALTRLRVDQPTRDYAERSRRQGKTDREIKRYIARNCSAGLNQTRGRLDEHRSVLISCPMAVF
jgi:hypothetical protein